MLIACYELGHQPLAVAWPAAALEARGFAPAVLDVSVEPLDAEKVKGAGLVAISVPMHTALRVGLGVAVVSPAGTQAVDTFARGSTANPSGATALTRTVR